MKRTVVVTGSTSGIGLGIARAFAAQGDNIVINGFGEASEVEAIRQSLEATGSRVIYHGADMSKPAEIEDLMATAAREFGMVDVLVNNAGILRLAMIDETTPEHWDQTFAVNVRGVFQMTQAVGAHMKERRYGRIVNIASLAARTGGPGQSHYAASKSAVVGFTRVSSMEFGGHGITVNAVCPGIIQTEMGRNNLRDPERVTYFEKITDLHRLGEPEDVVGPVAFFASDDSAFVTGQALNVDGGIFYS